jgi:predicted MFS family arabinose efflux permease
VGSSTAQQFHSILLFFGVSAITGIVVAAYLINRWLPSPALENAILFAATAMCAALRGNVPEIFWLATGMRGLPKQYSKDIRHLYQQAPLRTGHDAV